MKIVLLSDLTWNPASRALTNDDLKSAIKGHIPNTKEFAQINFYKRIIDKENADIVLFSGDVTGDGSCGHGYTMSFTILLQILESNKIYTLFIAGDHDEELYYKPCVDYCTRLKYVNSCDGKQVEIDGINFLGLSYQDTHKKTRMKKLLERTDKIDILFSHCEHKRRLSLFDFKTDFIISGHFDNKVAYIDKKVFISLSNDSPPNYATFELGSDTINVNYFCYSYLIQNFPSRSISHMPYCYSFYKTPSTTLKLVKSKSNLPTRTHRLNRDYYLINKEFEKAANEVIRIKRDKVKLSQEQFNRLTDIPVVGLINISKSFLLDYLEKGMIEKNKKTSHNKSN